VTSLLKLLRKEMVLQPEHPWEGRHVYLYGSVLKLGDKYRMYYQAFVKGFGFFVCLAESEDGISWRKPLLKPLSARMGEDHPTVSVGEEGIPFHRRLSPVEGMSNVVSTYHIPSVIPGTRGLKPYMLFGYTERGYCASFSDDGVNFEEHPSNPVIPLMRFPNRRTRKVWFSDVAPAFFDERKRVFRAMVKTYKVDRQGRTRRCVGMSTSRDFVRWSRPHTIWVPSEEHDEIARGRGFSWADFYGLCPFHLEGRYLGFLWLFLIDHELPRGTHVGKIEVYLAESPDCIRWRLVSHEPIIPSGDWHSGIVTTANQPLLVGGKLRVYFGGSNQLHGLWEMGREGEEARSCIGMAEFEVL